MLELKNICKSYKIREDKSQHVLKNLSVTFPSNGLVTLLGASGNGKTTILNIVGGLDTPDSGDIYFNNEKIDDFETFRREKVSFIFQDLNLIPHLNAVDNVILGISDEYTNKKERAIEILESLGLEESLYKRPDQLSGGQQQRVAIARTIAKNVDIIICDEPTGSLDNDTKKIITDILKELSKTKLVILITHNLDLANQYSDVIFETVDGQIINHSHKIKEGQFESDTKKRIYNSNVMWLALKNIIGRYKHTIRYALFIVFIMLIASASIVIQGEYVKKYIHDISLDTGIQAVRVNYQTPKNSTRSFDPLKQTENVEAIGFLYNTQVRLTTGRIPENPPLVSTDLIEMDDVDYFEDKLVVGRLPASSDEVLMTPASVIKMVTSLGAGGQRLRDQFSTGELDGQAVFDLIDLSSFTVFEKGWPKFKVVGLIDGSKIYEDGLTLYIQDGFTDLFEYTSRDKVSYVELPKRLEYAKTIIYKENVYRETHDVLISTLKSEGYGIDTFHEKRIHATYNKIDSFFSLSVVFLYVIIGIASISFVSLLSASIFDRKYEIGLYRTKGYTKFNIMKILGLEMYFLGFISLVTSIVILLITAFVMYLNIDYITSFIDVFKIINIPVLALALLGIVTVFVMIIVYISNSIILRASVLSNIKDTGHNKKHIRKQVAIVLIIFIMIGLGQVANKRYNILDLFKEEPIVVTDDSRDDFSNVEPTGIFEVYAKEDLEEDLTYIIGKLYTHTHLNTNYDQFIQSHNYAQENIFEHMTKLEFIRLTQPIIASLNCGNTALLLNDQLDHVKVFPQQVYVHKDKIYLLDNTFNQAVPIGSEITHINGLKSSDIINIIFASLPSEQDNSGYKYFSINKDFALNYLLSVEYAESFEVKYLTPDGQSNTTLIDGIDYEAVQNAKIIKEAYSQSFNDYYATLTIGSVSSNEDQLITFIDDFFRRLKEDNLNYLILDLRGNDVINNKITTQLLSYLQTEPSHFLSHDTTQIPLAENHYEGQLYILQNGGLSGSAGQLLALLKDKDIGYTIGQDASSYAQISSTVKSSNLEHTNIGLSIATSAAHVEMANIKESTASDYDVTATIDELIGGKDIELELAVHLIDRENAIDDFSNLEPVGLLETFSKKDLNEDLSDLKTLLLQQNQPFMDEDQMWQLYDVAKDRITDGMTKLEFMRLVQPIAASLNAYNTLMTSHDNIDAIKLFADQVYVENKNLYLMDNTFYTNIPVGSQITNINGRSVSDIIDQIFMNLSSDGMNESYKYALINDDFSSYYFRFIEYLEYFDISFITPDGTTMTLTVPGIEAKTIADAHESKKTNDDIFSQKFYDDYATLKLKAFSNLDNDDIATFFKTIKKENINYLILDLRDNQGGDISVTDQLLSYLSPASFGGEVLVLQDGAVASITSQFLVKLKEQNIGIFIGDETASSSKITTDVTSAQLTHTGLLFNYSTHVSALNHIDEDLNTGFMPDYMVVLNIEDKILGHDKQLAFAEEMIRHKLFHGEFYNTRMEGLFETYSKESLLFDLDTIVDTLRTEHTNLYTNMTLFDHLEKKIRTQLHDDMTKLEFIRLVSPLIASTNCRQTNLSFNVVDQVAKSLGGSYSQDVYDSNISVYADKLYIYKNKLYVYNNTFYGMPVGSEILSINGNTSSDIIETMLQSISSDGHNKSLKYTILNGNISWYYFLSVEHANKFEVVYRLPNGLKQSKTVYAESLNEIAKFNQRTWHTSEPITFETNDNYAYLDINSFALYDSVQQKNFRFALYDLFMEINVKGIDNLIIDLRGNAGGDPALAAKLLTYIQPKPHRYWSDYSADDSELSSPLATSSINYSGNLYVLIDSQSTSTTGHLASLIQYHDIATFIGEETGSSYMNSEDVLSLNLINTEMDIKYTTKVYEVDTPNLTGAQGIQPDYEIIPTINDLINQHDPVLEFTLKLIK